MDGELKIQNVNVKLDAYIHIYYEGLGIILEALNKIHSNMYLCP